MRRGNEPFGSVKCREFLDQIWSYSLFKSLLVDARVTIKEKTTYNMQFSKNNPFKNNQLHGAVLHENPINVVKNFPICYLTRRFITVFTIAHLLSLS